MVSDSGARDDGGVRAPLQYELVHPLADADTLAPVERGAVRVLGVVCWEIVRLVFHVPHSRPYQCQERAPFHLVGVEELSQRFQVGSMPAGLVAKYP